jgi:glucose/arabinose dehydrogenase
MKHLFHPFFQQTRRSKNWALSFLFFVVLSITLASPGEAQVFPQGFSQVTVAQNLNKATFVAFSPDGRIFIGEQAGRVRIVKRGTLLGTPFLTLSVNSSGERGIIGFTFDPNFTINGYVYVYYTLPDASRNRVSRFTATGDVAQVGSEKVILELDPLSSATNHNGGAMKFGKDGKLYIAIGDNANTAHPQNLDTYHGKVVRINPDGSVPTGNPFTTGTEQKRRIWAYGFRNPYTFDVHPVSGQLFVNDVGQSTWEEINNVTTGGGNYGWPRAEGMSTNTAFVNPVHAYPTSGNTGNYIGCAIVGGTFFNPVSTNYPPEYVGRYFFQDYCNGWIRSIPVQGGNSSLFASNLVNFSLALTTGSDGNLYYLNRNTSTLYKIVYTPSATLPVISSHPSSRTVAEGQSVTFSVSASGTAPLRYQWQKNGANLSGATSATFTIASSKTTDAGQYRVLVSNAVGSVTSNTATLTIQTTNKAPVATILTPAADKLYQGGETINFSGSATDTEDGSLPASAFSWEVVFYHDTHFHDGPPVATGVKSGSFKIPSSGETAHNVWYRLYLTVTDSKGLTHKIYRDIYPYKSILNFATEPAGLTINLDGKPLTTPVSVTGVAGITRSIGADATQTLNNIAYEFASWKHGGTKDQILATPQTNTTYTAVFRQKTDLRNGENPPTTVAGLEYQYYEGNWSALPNFASLTPLKTGFTSNFSLTQRNRNDDFAFRYTGFIQIPADGVYTFYTNSDDGSQLYIGNTLIVDNNGLHAAQERSGSIGLKSGKHAITVTFFERAGGEILDVKYTGPGISKQFVPSSALFRIPETTFTVKVNFQPESSAVPAGYVADYGDIFGSRGNNLSYGWNAPTKETRERSTADELKFRTLNHLQKPSNPNATWEVALPNGTYQVTLVCSDPLHTDQINTLLVENMTLTDPDGYDQLDQYSFTVSVTDGRLTIKPASGAMNAKISFVDISQIPQSVAKLESIDLPLPEIRLFPNPTVEALTLQITAAKEETISLVLTNALSQVVKAYTYSLARGENNINLETGQLPSGTYLLAILQGNKQTVKRISIVK